MKLFVIFATVVACTYAAPMSELAHPSPVNPNVLVELKPAEKIIFITDPNEMAKFKRETQRPLYPTVLPSVENHLHRAKREHQPSPQKNPRDPLPLQKPQPSIKPSVNKRNRREVEPVKVTQTLPAVNSGHIVVEVYQKSQVLPATGEPAPQTLEATSQKPNENDNKQNQPEVTTEKSSRPQGLPAIFSPSKKQKRDVLKSSAPILHHSESVSKDNSSEKQTHECKTEDLTRDQILKTQSQHKRDIPVPLVPKRQHPEESPKEVNQKENNEAEKEVKLESHQELHYKQEQNDFQKPQVLPEIVKESHEETQQRKRDIPVPLVPKHHHPEESLPDDKEKAKSENHHVQEHVTEEGFQNPQIMPALFKESETQPKRDIQVPLIPKYDHAEESLKEGDVREVNLNSHPDSHQMPHVLIDHSGKYVTHDGFQKPQVFPSIIQEPSPEIHQNKRDIPVPLVPKHQHPEESSNNIDNAKEIHDDGTKLNSEIHSTEGGFQKPQTLPAVLKESAVETQHKRDILPSVPSNDNSQIKTHDENKEPQKQPAASAILIDQQQKPDVSVPLAENHQHQEDNHHFSQTQHTPQILASHNHHMPTVHNQQHVFPKPQINAENNVATIPIIHKFQPKQHNEYTPHFHQRLTSENYEHTAQATHPAYNQEQVVPINIQNAQVQEHMLYNLQSPQVLPTNIQNSPILTTHKEAHVEPTNFQRPQSLPALNSHQKKPEIVPAVPKDTTESSAQTKRDVLASSETAVQSHKHEVAEEHKKQENYSNPDEVQVEDLSVAKPLNQPHHHMQLTHSEHKPNILDDHLGAHDLQSSTTEHPIFRHRPVSVAELFAKAHDN